LIAGKSKGPLHGSSESIENWLSDGNAATNIGKDLSCLLSAYSGSTSSHDFWDRFIEINKSVMQFMKQEGKDSTLYLAFQYVFDFSKNSS